MSGLSYFHTSFQSKFYYKDHYAMQIDPLVYPEYKAELDQCFVDNYKIEYKALARVLAAAYNIKVV